jgi:hypothetical protein
LTEPDVRVGRVISGRGPLPPPPPILVFVTDVAERAAASFQTVSSIMELPGTV